MRRAAGILLGLALISLPAWAGGVDVSGMVFGDAYWFASIEDPALRDLNGFWFRRIYLGFDKTLDGSFDARLRFEADSPGPGSPGEMEPFVKDAYLRWRAHPNHSLVFGLSPSPLLATAEELWGYRHVEKTPADLQRMGSSRDFGLALKGKLGAEGRVGYHAMAGNGQGTGNETDKGKNLQLALDVAAAEGVLLHGVAGWNDLPGETDWITLQGAAGWSRETFRAGALAVHQIRRNAAGPGKGEGSSGDLDLTVLSIWGAVDVNRRARIFGRLDASLDANPAASSSDYLPLEKGARALVVIAGIDVSVAADVRVLPNVEIVRYSDPEGAGDAPDATVIPRVTLYYVF
jgi:hypothetical protein